MQTTYNFDGRVAVVTGGSGVLCGAVSRRLGQSGARVVVLGHSNLDSAEEVVHDIESAGGTAAAMQCDVLNRESIQEVALRTLSMWDRIDILINGAGGTETEATTSEELPLFDLPEDAVRHVMDLNFTGTFFACQVFGRVMADQEAGVILNFSSMGALRPLTRNVAYSAAKAAVTNFTRWLAVHMSQEYSKQIRVNALVPGFFITDQNRFLLTDEQTGEFTERGERIIAHTPMGRFGQPQDLVGPALWLLSDEAHFVHGTSLIVDGGMSAYGGV